MSNVIVVLFYSSILFCAVISGFTLVKFMRAPLHLRWELYRGSSVYETPEWWAKDPLGLSEKFIPIILEILCLRDFYEK